MRRLWILLLLPAIAALAQEPEHPSAADYRKALKLQKHGKWVAAKRAFERFLRKWPDSPYAADAEIRSDDNAYLGSETMWKSGPHERRIDVAVMGDGFTVQASDQRKQAKWARLCLDVLWNEAAFGEYRNYFNIYFVRLASLEEGVDPQLSPEERKKIEERNRRRARKKKTDFDTALDAKAAGPQGQVMMNRGLVYKWLDIADRDVPGCGDDRFVIAFAQFGRLGMGGGGVANVGRPDKSITTHEFGHAFSRLLDEYAVNPGAPQGRWARQLRAANAYPSLTEPSKDEVPWAHMLRRRIKGVGIFEGGATFKKGVWRPARTCAMNAAGATSFCPVCREQTIRVIYEYVSPIDTCDPPPGREVRAVHGDKTRILVTPMQPVRHKLVAEWYAAPLAPVTPAGDEAAAPGSDPDDDGDSELSEEELRALLGLDGERRGGSNPFRGRRAARPRDAYAAPPDGKPAPYGKALRGKPRRLAFECGKLVPGRYTVTVVVSDPTPWVIKDDNHLLEERASWTVSVSPKPSRR